MRVSTSSTYDATIANLQRRAQELSRSQEQMSSLKRVLEEFAQSVADPEVRVGFRLFGHTETNVDAPGAHTDTKLVEPIACGVGLGLAVARRIVEAHGGTITAESPRSGGTAFRVTIPVHA